MVIEIYFHQRSYDVQVEWNPLPQQEVLCHRYQRKDATDCPAVILPDLMEIVDGGRLIAKHENFWNFFVLATD